MTGEQRPAQMDELGIILREARETQGLTLADVNAETRISARFLEALEAGEYDRLPTPVHVRAYLRNYARFLRLDAEPLLTRYNAVAGERPSPPPPAADPALQRVQPLPELEDSPFFNPVNMELDNTFEGRDSEAVLRLVIIIALIFAIIIVANRFIPLLTGNGDGTQAVQEAIVEIINERTGTPEATPDLNQANFFVDDTALEAGQAITATSRNVGDPAAPNVSATRPSLPATMERVNLRLDILERTWIQVTIDGEVVLEDMLTREDGPYQWEALQEARVLTGNAAGVFVTINDIELGKMGSGARSEVVEEMWQATGN